MKTLKVLSALLSYPQPELLAALEEMVDVLEHEQMLPDHTRKAVLTLLERLNGTDLLELQEQYVTLFDRGRALSLHLYEHVCGESRQRGQAMVNLLGIYRRHGFELSARELPDYIPLFLEYLSQRPQGEAIELLVAASPVLALLSARLAGRGSDYHVVFDALTELAGEPRGMEDIRRTVAGEGQDETLLNMDAIWEEEAVTFVASHDACPLNRKGGDQPPH